MLHAACNSSPNSAVTSSNALSRSTCSLHQAVKLSYAHVTRKHTSHTRHSTFQCCCQLSQLTNKHRLHLALGVLSLMSHTVTPNRRLLHIWPCSSCTDAPHLPHTPPALHCCSYSSSPSCCLKLSYSSSLSWLPEACWLAACLLAGCPVTLCWRMVLVVGWALCSVAMQHQHRLLAVVQGVVAHTAGQAGTSDRASAGTRQQL